MDTNEKIEELEREAKQLEKKMQESGFWQNKEEAAKVQKRYSSLKDNLKLIAETKDKYDKGTAVLSISSGAGGRDAEDWVALLQRMYQRYFESKGWGYKLLAQTLTEGGGPEGRIGIKDITMQVKGKFAYGLLKKETGVHRLVRISPFSAKQLRHTSFAKVEVLPEIKETEVSEIKIKPEDLKIETFRASGPGGQYVNKRESAVRITHLPTELQAASQAERLQGLNRKVAMRILIAKLLQLREQKREKTLEEIKGKMVSAEFGRQIRSYVLHPYKLVKDHRTEVQTSDVDGVLGGNLDLFIERK